MARLGTLKGNGVLVIDQLRIDPITYWFDVDLKDGVRSADGRITGDRHGLEAAAKAPSIQLQMQDGSTMAIRITELDPHGARAVTTGRIPGF
jgi:hypothetical protein